MHASLDTETVRRWVEDLPDTDLESLKSIIDEEGSRRDAVSAAGQVT